MVGETHEIVVHGDEEDCGALAADLVIVSVFALGQEGAGDDLLTRESGVDDLCKNDLRLFKLRVTVERHLEFGSAGFANAAEDSVNLFLRRRVA